MSKVICLLGFRFSPTEGHSKKAPPVIFTTQERNWSQHSSVKDIPVKQGGVSTGQFLVDAGGDLLSGFSIPTNGRSQQNYPLKLACFCDYTVSNSCTFLDVLPNRVASRTFVTAIMLKFNIFVPKMINFSPNIQGIIS